MAWILASVLGPVCKRMLDGTIEEYRIVRDVNEEIMNLRRTVFVIMRKLEDAERKQVESHAIRLRLKELKQVLFDAEDVFDEIATDEALERDAEGGTSRQLKVLNLDYCEGIRALPRNMSALINLRHLIGERDIIVERDRHSFLVSGIQGLGKLTALHELDDFDCGRQPMKELADMGMLRRLCIRSLEKVKSREEAAGSRLDKKEHLDELTLVWSRGRDNHLINPGLEEEVLDSLQPSPHSTIRELTIDDYGGTRSPSWMEDQSWLRDSCFLRTLKLYDCTNWEVLPPLGQLLCLDSLEIKGMRRVRRIGPAFMGCCRQVPQGGFPSLQEQGF